MPGRISDLLRKNWTAFDTYGDVLVQHLSAIQELAEFPHARSTFGEHLVGTFGILGVWGQPSDVTRCGLVHTAYSGDLFQFYLFDAGSEAQRADLRALVGQEAEALTWLFGTVHRGSLINLSGLMAADGRTPRVEDLGVSLSSGASDMVEVPHRLHTSVNITNAQVAKLIVVTLADYLEQMVEVNGWRDHHQEEDLSGMLFPGDGRPALALHWVSAACASVAKHLEIVPPIFDRCTRVIRRDDEKTARDAYWRVVVHERSLTVEEQREALHVAVEHNPWVGEPHILLAQLAYREADFASASHHADEAVRKLYPMATAWDKRRGYSLWVGYARLLGLRARRKLSGDADSLPVEEDMPPTFSGKKLISVDKLSQMLI